VFLPGSGNLKTPNYVVWIIGILIIYFSPMISLDTAKILAVYSALWILYRELTDNIYSHVNFKKQERLIEYLEERIEHLEYQSEINEDDIFDITKQVVDIQDPSYKYSEEFELELNTHKEDKTFIKKTKKERLNEYREDIEKIEKLYFH
jgi:hypothetical protein